jgi:hypothetical protein
MQFLLILAILLAVVFFVSAPLRRAALGRAAQGGAWDDDMSAFDPRLTELADLEAARDAKYREIRDAELDHLTGKLSDRDFEALNADLRAEAVQILRDLDRAQGN